QDRASRKRDVDGHGAAAGHAAGGGADLGRARQPVRPPRAGGAGPAATGRRRGVAERPARRARGPRGGGRADAGRGRAMITALVRAVAGRRLVAPGAVPEDVAIVRGRWLPALGGRLAGMRRAAAAVTIGRTIVLHDDAPLTTRLLRHELAHVEQWRAAPWTFPVRYAWQHLRCGYRDNPYEVAARAA